MVIRLFSVDCHVLSEFLQWLMMCVYMCVCVCVCACYEYVLSTVYTISLSQYSVLLC
jgi:hypothetical protein